MQPSLNCEELDAKLGLELRWTMSQDDIILQLVSNTGNDRYLALGIRDPTESKGIAGKSNRINTTGNDRYLALGIRNPSESKGIASKSNGIK